MNAERIKLIYNTSAHLYEFIADYKTLVIACFFFALWLISLVMIQVMNGGDGVSSTGRRNHFCAGGWCQICIGCRCQAHAGCMGHVSTDGRCRLNDGDGGPRACVHTQVYC